MRKMRKMRKDSIEKHNREFLGSLNPRYFTEEEMGKIKEGLEAEDFDMMEEALLSGFVKQREYLIETSQKVEDVFNNINKRIEKECNKNSEVNEIFADYLSTGEIPEIPMRGLSKTDKIIYKIGVICLMRKALERTISEAFRLSDLRDILVDNIPNEKEKENLHFRELLDVIKELFNIPEGFIKFLYHTLNDDGLKSFCA